MSQPLVPSLISPLPAASAKDLKFASLRSSSGRGSEALGTAACNLVQRVRLCTRMLLLLVTRSPNEGQSHPATGHAWLHCQ